LIDEDMSGDITLKELQKTLTAFQAPVEDPGAYTSDSGHVLTIEQQALIRVYE
jgi:hypothetical protein